ncbi:chromosome transmission fidelity 4 isoform X2 [Lycorma delicatula]|uniref:chromosome transmission fidelity 4 isoform X2 n=1 Tax=Lycorma delicatula TaxID=130591 RepID=UPI003F518B92
MRIGHPEPLYIAMPFILKPLRYAHSEGHTNVCFSDDGKFIVTCGSEGDIRIWKGFEDEEPVDKCVGDKAYAVIVKGDKMFVGTNNNYVQSFTFPESELDGIVTRFKAPVTSIDASCSGKFVVCGSQDMEIHVTEDGTLSSVLTDHKAPVLSVAVDPKGEYFASSSCDGSVKIWKLSSEIKEVVTSWDCIPKSNSVETSVTLCKISWAPITGYLLAVPCENEICLYARHSWQKTMSLTIPSVDKKQVFSVCSYSHCSQYLAASTTDKKLHVWNVKKGKLEFTFETKEAPVCAIAWQPSSSDKYEFVFCNTEGYLGSVEYSPTDNDSTSLREIEDIHNDVPQINSGNDAGYLGGNNDDDDNEFAISVEKIKADMGFNPDGSMIDNCDRVRNRSRSRSRTRSRSRSTSRSHSPRAVIPQIDMQLPFQPSATPTCLQFRFMAWNDIGIIEQTNTEDDQAISVKFHDSSFHYPFRISNELNYSMAALSSDVVVFASEKVDEKLSYLGCHPLKKGIEWFTELPEDEEAVAVTAGIGWVAVATSMQTLRIFTLAGNQREVLSLPGPVVCLGGYKNILAATFHMSSGIGGHQWLGYSLLEVRPADICKFIIPSQSLPLSPGSTLKWMGFSDCGALCTSDSSGFVRLLSSAQGWHPICNTRKNVKGKSDHYFVLGVNEIFQTIKVILCKGSDYPPVIPVPYMTELPWKVPLCGSMEEKGGLEEVLWRSKLALHCLESSQMNTDNDVFNEAQKKNTVEINRTIMKLFSIACLENHSLRAFEVCQLSDSALLMERAMQYAHLQNKTGLAEQIAELLAEKKAREENGVENNSTPNMYSDVLAVRHVQESNWLHHYMQSDRRLQQNGYHNIVTGSEGDKAFENSSQDMFAESIDSKMDTSSFTDIQKKTLSPYSGRLSSSKEDVSLIRKRALNPFKKGLIKLSDASVGSPATPITNKTNTTLAGIISRKSKADKEKLEISLNDSTPSKNILPPFKDWFNNEKENYQRENPNMSIAQITKIALKKYKELKISNSVTDMTQSSFETVTVADVINESCSDAMITESPAPVQDNNKKRKHSNGDDNGLEEKMSETESHKSNECQPKKNSKLNQKKNDPEIKKGVVKSVNKLTGFFHKKQSM